MSNLPTKQDLLNKCKGYIAVNKDVAKLLPQKTMTRRVIKDQLRANCILIGEDDRFITENAKYKVGEIYWIREPAKIINTNITESRASYDHVDLELGYKFLADNTSCSMLAPVRFVNNYDNHPSFKKEWIYNNKGVPNGCIKEMARHFVKIKSVKVERLQDISVQDVEKEGIKTLPPTAKKGINDRYSNPYVFVYEYKLLEHKG